MIGSAGLTNISGGARSAFCDLYDGTNTFGGEMRALDASSQKSSAATVTGVVSLPAATTVEFRCWANDTNVWVPSGSRPSIAAVPVTGITTQ